MFVSSVCRILGGISGMLMEVVPSNALDFVGDEVGVKLSLKPGNPGSLPKSASRPPGAGDVAAGAQCRCQKEARMLHKSAIAIELRHCHRRSLRRLSIVIRPGGLLAFALP